MAEDINRLKAALRAAHDAKDADAARRIAALIKSSTYDVASDAITKGAQATPEGPLESIAIGAGRTFDRAAKGLEQGFYRVTGNQGELARMEAEESGNDAAMRKLREKNPLSTFAGEVAPYFALPLTPSIGSSAALGAGTQGLMYTPEGESSMVNAAQGALAGAAGYGLSKALTKAISPGLKTNLSPSQQKIAADAKELGAKLTPGQELGSTPLQRLEASLESFPPTSGVIGAVKEGNKAILNKAAAKSIGETADDVSTPVLDNAFDRLGKQFDSIKNIPAISTKGLKSSINTVKQSSAFPEVVKSNPFFKEAESLVKKGMASGRQMQDLISRIGKRAHSEMRSASGNREVGISLYQLREVLDDAVDSVLPKAEQAARQTARQEYRTLMQLMTGNVVNEATGDVSPRLLANVLSRTDRAGMRLGKNQSDLYTMGRFAKAFPEIVGDSGTASRSFVQWLLSTGGAGALGGTALGNPLVGAAVGLGTPLAARGAANAYVRSSPYLMNQLIPEMTQRGLAGEASRIPLGLLNQQ